MNKRPGYTIAAGRRLLLTAGISPNRLMEPTTSQWAAVWLGRWYDGRRPVTWHFSDDHATCIRNLQILAGTRGIEPALSQALAVAVTDARWWVNEHFPDEAGDLFGEEGPVDEPVQEDEVFARKHLEVAHG